MSDILRKLVEHIPIPKLVKIRQSFDDTILEDPIQRFDRKSAYGCIHEGDYCRAEGCRGRRQPGDIPD